MNFFVMFVCQGSAVRDLVITDSSVTDSVLVWPFQVSKDSNVSLRSKRSRTSEELPQSGFIKIGARAKIIKQDGCPNLRAIASPDFVRSRYLSFWFL